MKLFFITGVIAFFVFLATALVVNFCRKKLRKGPHGLTGMCHRDGGAACSGCVDKESDHSSK